MLTVICQILLKSVTKIGEAVGLQGGREHCGAGSEFFLGEKTFLVFFSTF